MKPLLAGIYSKYAALTGEAHNSFYTSLTGGLHNTVAPQPTIYPYGVFLLVASVPDWCFGTGEDFDEAMIQFSLFDNARSAVSVMDAAGYCKTLYHRQALTVTGYTTHHMYLENEMLMREEEDTIWHYMLQFRVLLEKSS